MTGQDLRLYTRRRLRTGSRQSQPGEMRMVMKRRELREKRLIRAGKQRIDKIEGLRKHSGLRGKEGTKRGHGRRNLNVKNTASVTSCQVRNKGCGLNGLRAGPHSERQASARLRLSRKALDLFQDRFDGFVAYRRPAEPAVFSDQQRNAGERGDQLLGVRMLWRAKDLRRRTALDDLAGVENRDPMTEDRNGQ